jgi:excisionase family DNA binding protein
MMKAEDVARSLQISMRTLYRWLSAGTAPAADFRLGKVLRWRRETVDAWIANHGGAQ